MVKNVNLLLPQKKLSNLKLSNLLLPREKLSNLLVQERGGEDLAGKDAEIERLRLGAGGHARALLEKEQTIASKDLELAAKDGEIAARGGEIERLRLGAGEHARILAEMGETARRHEEAARKHGETAREHARMLVERAGKDAEIKRLQAHNLENSKSLQVPVPHRQL